MSVDGQTGIDRRTTVEDLCTFAARVLVATGVPGARRVSRRGQPRAGRPLGAPVARGAPPALVRRPASLRGDGRRSRRRGPWSDTGPLLLLDGGHGIGQVLADHAREQAVTRAREFGIGAVAVRDSNHFGTAMYYTRRAAHRDAWRS